MYIYPKLPAVKTFHFLRIGGNGLANCMFVAARAFVKAKKNNLMFIEPTWFNLSLGTYLRCQKDKRHYSGIFRNYGKNYGLRKSWLLISKRSVKIDNQISFNGDVVYVESGLGNYFEDIIADYELVSDYFKTIINPEIISKISSKNFSHSIAVHIRLGDYSENLRVPISWYRDLINLINLKTEFKYEFLVFSDGSQHELQEVLSINNVKFFFAGNAIADIVAISKCKLVIGSDSTFSGWGIYLGQVPCIFFKKHYGKILNDNNELIAHKIDEELINNFIANYV